MKKLRRLFQTCSLVLVLAALVSCASSPKGESIDHPPTTGKLELRGKGERPLIAYALGSGAARGFAHVGVLNALERAGITPDLIVGTSSGAIVGALYASGIHGEELSQVALEVQRKEVFDYTASRRGVITGHSLQAYINSQVHNRLLEELQIPFAVVATDLRSGEKAVFTRGDAGLAVRAGSSFPGLFKPAVVNGREFVDGGVLSPVPVDTAFDLGADIVVAVDVGQPPSSEAEIDGWIDVLRQSYFIMARVLSAVEVSDADVVIRPVMEDMSMLDFDMREMAIRAGEQAAMEAVPLIRRILQQRSAE